MKNSNIFFRLLIASLLFVACSEEEPAGLDASLYEPNIDTPEENAGVFITKINDQDFVVENVTARLDNNVITISGKQGNQVVTLQMPVDIQPNDITNPYILGAGNDLYKGFYDTDVSLGPEIITTSYATNTGDSRMVINTGEIQESWVGDRTTATVENGVTTITVDKGNFLNSLELKAQTDQTGNYTFGPNGNIATYEEPISIQNATVDFDVYQSDITTPNGVFNITVDQVNKLINGTFSFSGSSGSLSKDFAEGSLNHVPFGDPDIKRGLNISRHEIDSNRIVGTFSFISATIGENPAQWYLLTEGSFDVNYSEVE
jgi:hypothetical protein